METVGVIGVGKLGICLALILENAGYTVRGYDNNAQYRDLLRKKELVSIEPGLVDALKQSKNLYIDDDLVEIYKLSTIFVVVNTPSLPDGSYNHTAVDSVVEEIRRLNALHRAGGDKLFVVSCTTMPGYCDTVQDRLTEFGYTICYNPEFIQQGDIIKGMTKPDMVLIGGDDLGNSRLSEHYKRITVNSPPIHAMSRKDAEITKIALNCFLTTKIAFANAVGDLVIKAGGNPSVVLDAIGSDSRVGKKFLRWGHGFGGPCLPRDNRALCHFANSISFKHTIGETTDASNGSHILNVVEYIQSKNAAKLPYYFSYVVYKKGTHILEESQQFLLANRLVDNGGEVYISESPTVFAEIERLHPGKFKNAQGVDVTAMFHIDSYIQ